MADLRKTWIVWLSESQNHRCCYCGQRTEYQTGCDNTATIDHIITRSDRGSNSRDNLVMCCYRCNQDKGNKGPRRYLKEIASGKVYRRLHPLPDVTRPSATDILSWAIQKYQK